MRLLFLILGIALVISIRARGGPVPGTNTHLACPWEPSSKFVRVPKSFLAELNIDSMSSANMETMEFFMTPEFKVCFGVTKDKSAQLEMLVNNALDQYRTLQSVIYLPRTCWSKSTFSSNQ